MSDPHDGPLAESNEAKFARVMKALAVALRDAHEANRKISLQQARSAHAVTDLAIASRMTRLLAWEGPIADADALILGRAVVASVNGPRICSTLRPRRKHIAPFSARRTPEMSSSRSPTRSILGK